MEASSRLESDACAPTPRLVCFLLLLLLLLHRFVFLFADASSSSFCPLVPCFQVIVMAFSVEHVPTQRPLVPGTGFCKRVVLPASCRGCQARAVVSRLLPEAGDMLSVRVDKLKVKFQDLMAEPFRKVSKSQTNGIRDMWACADSLHGLQRSSKAYLGLSKSASRIA